MNTLKITVALGLGEKEHKKIDLLISDLKNKKVLTTEIIRYRLGSYLPGIFTALCELIDLNATETNEKLLNGEISSEILPYLFRQYEKKLGISDMEVEYDNVLCKDILVNKFN